jgi:CHASE2 domain-containing sensor protein
MTDPISPKIDGPAAVRPHTLGEVGADHEFSVKREFGILALFVALVTGAKWIGLLDPIERAVTDLFAATAPDRTARHTALIDIDDASYATSFGGVSPLARPTLASLIKAALDASARAVVVDVDTDQAEIESLLTSRGVTDLERIVWARDGDPCGTSHGCVRPLGPLSERHGLALLVLDDDGAVRRYSPEFKIGHGNGASCACGEETHASLPRVAIRAAGVEEGQAPHKPLILNWSGRYAIPRLPASRVLEDSKQEWWGRSQPIRGRVVLIGGTFRAGRDTRATPIGPLTGVEIFAHIVESEMAGGGLAQFNLFGAVMIEFVMGGLLIWLNWIYPAETRASPLINAAAVLVLPVLASWMLYRYALFWVNLAPVLAGVWVHQWHTRAHHLARAARTKPSNAVPASAPGETPSLPSPPPNTGSASGAR